MEGEDRVRFSTDLHRTLAAPLHREDQRNNGARPSVPGRIRSTSRLEQEPGPTFSFVDPNLYETGARNIPVFIAHIVSFA